METIENVGSIARDHLANERTFLSWLRTGVTLMGVGVALVKFEAIMSGIFLAIIGTLFVGTSLYRFYEVMHALNQGKYIINSNCILFITICSIFFIILAFGVIIIENYM